MGHSGERLEPFGDPGVGERQEQPGRRLVIRSGRTNPARAVSESGNACTTVSASTIGSTGWNGGLASSQVSVRVMPVMLALERYLYGL